MGLSMNSVPAASARCAPQQREALAAVRCELRDEPPGDWPDPGSGSAAATGFLRPAWFEAWSRQYGSIGSWHGPVAYVVASDKRGTSAVLPIARQIVKKQNFTSLAGSYMPFRDFVMPCGRPDVAAAVVRFLKDDGSTEGLRLGPVSSGSVAIRALEEALREAGWGVTRRRLGEQFVVALPDDAEAYVSTLAKKKIKKIRYYWRKLCSEAPTELVHYNGAEGVDWPAVFADLAAVEKRSWVFKNGEPHFCGEGDSLYWSELCQDGWFGEHLNIWMIYHAGKPVSFCMALDSGATRYIIANSYDEAVADFSTGSKLYEEMFRQAIAKGLKQVNIGQGDSGYKAHWRAEVLGTLDEIIAFPPGALGRLKHLALKGWLRFAAH